MKHYFYKHDGEESSFSFSEEFIVKQHQDGLLPDETQIRSDKWEPWVSIFTLQGASPVPLREQEHQAQQPSVPAQAQTSHTVKPEDVFIWYYLIGNAQFGPFDEDSVIRQIQAGSLNGDTLVWTLALDAWKPIRETNLRIFVRPPPIPASSSSLPAKPHSPGSVLIQGSNDEPDVSKDREIYEPTPTRGIGRGLFFAALIGINVCIIIMNAFLLRQAVIFLTLIILLPLVLWIASLRFKSMNASKWAWIGIILPLANLFVLFMCLVYPPDYYPNRKLDTVGKILTWMCILAVVCISAAVLISSM
ncbi:MAG: GYF domain-containing protein [Verrucomicrobiae bacterium]